MDFHDTYITSVCEDITSSCSDKDSLVGTPMYTAASAVSAKMVGIDVEVMRSAVVYGMTVAIGSRLLQPPVLSARLPPVSFSGLQGSISVAQPRGYSPGSVRFQTLLEDVEWNDELLYGKTEYSFLRQLREATNGTLSVSFTTYIYNVQPLHKDYTVGYVVGTIGPGSRFEPSGYVRERALQPAVPSATGLNGGAQFKSRASGVVTVDFSNVVTRRYVDGSFKLNTEDMGHAHVVSENIREEHACWNSRCVR